MNRIGIIIYLLLFMVLPISSIYSQDNAAMTTDERLIRLETHFEWVRERMATKEDIANLKQK